MFSQNASLSRGGVFCGTPNASFSARNGPVSDPDFSPNHHSPVCFAQESDFPSRHHHIIDTLPMLNKLGSIAIPAISSSFISFSLQVVAQIFIGQNLGAEALAQIAIALTIVNMFGTSLGFGLSSALDTLASQAFGRDPESPEIGEDLQRAISVLYVIGVPIAVLFFFFEPIAVAVFGPTLGVGASEYLRWIIPYLFILYAANAIFRTLEAQNQPQLVTIANVITAAVCPLFNLLFTHRGIWGAAVAVTCTMFVNLVVLVSFCVWHPKVVIRKASFPAHDLLKWTKVKQFLKIALPSLLSICSEWWVFEVTIVLASMVSTTEVACLSIAWSLLNVLVSFPMGLGTSCSVCIGNSLGSGHPDTAHKYKMLGLIVSLVLSLFTMSFYLVGGKYLISAFTNDPVITETLSRTIPLIATGHFIDNTQTVIQGIFRGAGKQHRMARVLLFSQWFVGISLCTLFALVCRWGVAGIMIGLFTGLLVEIPLFMMDLVKWDWIELAATASAKAN